MPSSYYARKAARQSRAYQPYRSSRSAATLSRMGNGIVGAIMDSGLRSISSSVQNALKRKRSSTTTTSSKKRSKSNSTSYYGQKRRFSKRKVKYYAKKKKLPKVFKKNFDKCLDWNKNLSRYVYQANVQLRQQTINQYSIYYTDINGYQITMGGAKDILDAFSKTFGAKSNTPDFAVTTNNLDDDAKYHVTNGEVNFFFKSTSSHVVNIELYEATFKTTFNAGFDTIVSQSISSMNGSVGTFDGSGLPTNSAYSLTWPNSKFSDVPDLFNYCSLKMHRIKLQPGDHASRTFLCIKDKTFNLQSMQQNNALPVFAKGQKYFFFRVLNDVTVSGDVSANKIHAFPSNNKGGVACRYSRSYRLRQPDNALITEASVKLEQYNHATETTDQQVCLENPVAIASFSG